MARWQSPHLHKYLERRSWELWERLRGGFVVMNGSLGPNPAGAQCVNVPNTLYRRLGLPPIGGNALDWAGFEDAYRVFRPYKNSLRLKVGDAAVFLETASGGFGHVDLVVDGSVDPYLGVDQNWPPGYPVSLVQHSRTDLAGVVRVVRLSGHAG